MYNHNKAQQSKNRVHISWDILYISFTARRGDDFVRIDSQVNTTRSNRAIFVTQLVGSKIQWVNVMASQYVDCFSSPRLAAVGLSGGFVLMATIGQGYAMKDRLWLAIQSAAK